MIKGSGNNWRKKGNRVKRSGKWSDGHKVALIVADHKWRGIYYLRDVSTGEYVEHHWNGPCGGRLQWCCAAGPAYPIVNFSGL